MTAFTLILKEHQKYSEREAPAVLKFVKRI